MGVGGVGGLTGLDIAAAVGMSRQTRRGPVKLRPESWAWVRHVYMGDEQGKADLLAAVMVRVSGDHAFIEQHRKGVAALAFEERMRNVICRVCNGSAEKCKACKGRGTFDLSGRRRARIIGVHHHAYKRNETAITQEVMRLYGIMGNWQDEADRHIERMTREV